MNGKPPWKIKSIAKQNDYNYALVEDHPNATKKGYVLEHRVVMENYLGRLLTNDEVVHHKDGNKRNNDINNLELMSNSNHTKFHNIEKSRYKLKLMVEMKCPICGKIFDRIKNKSICSTRKRKFNVCCCSKHCSVIMSNLLKNNNISEELQQRISENFQDVYYEYNDPDLND